MIIMLFPIIIAIRYNHNDYYQQQHYHLHYIDIYFFISPLLSTWWSKLLSSELPWFSLLSWSPSSRPCSQSLFSTQIPIRTPSSLLLPFPSTETILNFITELYWVNYWTIPSGFRTVRSEEIIEGHPSTYYDRVTRYTNDAGILIPGRGRERNRCLVAYNGTAYYTNTDDDSCEVKASMRCSFCKHCCMLPLLRISHSHHRCNTLIWPTNLLLNTKYYLAGENMNDKSFLCVYMTQKLTF